MCYERYEIRGCMGLLQVLARLVVGGVEEVEPVLAVGVDHGLVADVGVEDGVAVPEVGAALHEVAPEKQDAVCWQLQQLPLIVDEHPKLGGPLAGCETTPEPEHMRRELSRGSKQRALTLSQNMQDRFGPSI